MLAAVRFLLIAAVLWCGTHVEPVRAHYEASHQFSKMDKSDPDEPAGQGGAAHASHHHCPMASPHGDGEQDHGAIQSDALLFARPVAVLGSLAQPPPLEPPAF